MVKVTGMSWGMVSSSDLLTVKRLQLQNAEHVRSDSHRVLHSEK